MGISSKKYGSRRHLEFWISTSGLVFLWLGIVQGIHISNFIKIG
jgi:hypothetical protein